jgi:hypothetical protein
MAPTRHLPPLAIPTKRDVQPLPDSPTPSDQGRAETDMLPMSTEWHPVVADRVGATEGNGIAVPSTDLHLALVIDDMKNYDLIRQSIHLIKPHLWPGRVFIHILRRNPKLSPDDIAAKLALVDLGMANADTIGLNDGLQVSMGWPTNEHNP